jgi:hypothetical protein
MHPDDRIRLLHMKDAATEAISFAASRTREDLPILLELLDDVLTPESP